VQVKVETDPARLRPSDVPVLLGDYSKFKKATGWEPEIPYDKTLADSFSRTLICNSPTKPGAGAGRQRAVSISTVSSFWSKPMTSWTAILAPSTMGLPPRTPGERRM